MTRIIERYFFFFLKMHRLQEIQFVAISDRDEDGIPYGK